MRSRVARRGAQVRARRGAILLIVLTMLALLAVVGLSFVLFSESEATVARVHRDSRNTPSDDAIPDPGSVANEVFGQLIFSQPMTGSGTLTGFRGYDMATMVYGYRPESINFIPYNGIGGFNETLSIGTLTSRHQVINYSHKPGTTLFDPEYVGPRADPNTPRPSTDTYIGRNAAYTYPDRNNAYVALVNPNTGEIVVPSFHRPSLFGSFDPSNPKWTSPEGRYMTVRPRPADHTPDFPFPTPNPDGSYTGDVQNLLYANGKQKNDSIWIDANLPVIRWRGQLIKPLVAPLILPLDGRVNVNVAGNTKNGGSQASQMGFGAWEIDPSMILGGATNTQQLVAARYGVPNTPPINPPAPNGSTVAYRLFHPEANNFNDPDKQIAPPDYAKVDFDGVGAGAPMTLPTGFASNPVYPVPGYDNATTASGETANHPALWNPFQWTQNPAATGARAFPVGDLRQLSGRYSDRPRKYSQPYLGSTFDPIFGPTAGSGPFDPANGADANRIAAVRRALTTTISNSVNRPGLAPNFGMGSTQTFDLAGPNTLPTLSSLPTFTTATAGSWTIPDGVANQARNQWAALGALDLNRPLVDYRDSGTRPATINAATPWPLNDTTVTAASYTAAKYDRHLFAREIYARMVLATGASATVAVDASGTITVTPTVAAGTTQFDALRWLAQLAANMVDQIDDDDVSTVFVWNPSTPGAPATEFADAANFDVTGAAPAINDRTVFGVEKPRLVLNEIYAEVANSQSDNMNANAAAPFQVRFFIELLNPGSPITDPTNPLYFSNAAPGSVPLRFAGPGISCYKIEVYKRNGTTARTNLANPSNVAGIAVPGTPPDLDMDFLDVVAPGGAPAGIADRVEPNNGLYKSTGGNRNGFAVIGPQLDRTLTDSIAFVPDTNAAPFDQILQKPTPAAASTNKLQYDTTQVTETTWEDVTATAPATSFKEVNLNQHAVLLRRLACPYRPAGPDNPYITVDYMSRVSLRDAVRVAADPMVMGMDGVRAPAPIPTDFRSIGRVQPYAGNEGADPDTATLAAGDGLTIRQQPNPALAAQQHTLFQHNGRTPDTAANPAPTAPGDETLVMPFEWMPHLDRKLVNQFELLHTSVYPPHMLTHRFANPKAAARPVFHRHAFQRPADIDPGPDATLGTADDVVLDPGGFLTTNAPLYRFFEMLSVRPWGYGLPLGGRVPGKININMLWDQDPTTNRSQVFDALLLANGAVPAGNGFTLTDDVPAIWNALKASRSPGWTTSTPVVGTTIHEDAAGTDRPFHALGAPQFAADGTTVLSQTGLTDTILRNRTTADPDGVTRSLFQRVGSLHPFQSWEPLRKTVNNLTTTTDCYLVVFTIGYFEVRNNPPFGTGSLPQLGREVYQTFPGDMRSKYVGVIDRTQIGVDQNGNQGSAGWSVDLAEAAPVGTTSIRFPIPYQDGVAVTPTVIRLGVGDKDSGWGDGEWVTVSGTTVDTATGLMTANLSAATIRPHPAGAPVGNLFLRNPGPQPGFNMNDPRFRGVLPFFARVAPNLP